MTILTYWMIWSVIYLVLLVVVYIAGRLDGARRAETKTRRQKGENHEKTYI